MNYPAWKIQMESKQKQKEFKRHYSWFQSPPESSISSNERPEVKIWHSAAFPMRALLKNPWLRYQPTHIWTERLLCDVASHLSTDLCTLINVSDADLLSLSKLMLTCLPRHLKKDPLEITLPELVKRNFDWTEFAEKLFRDLFEDNELIIEPQIIESVVQKFPQALRTYLESLDWQMSKCTTSFNRLLASSLVVLQETALWVKQCLFDSPDKETVAEFASLFIAKMRTINSLSFLYPLQNQTLVFNAELLSGMPPSLGASHEKRVINEFLKLSKNDAKVFRLHFPELVDLLPVY